MSLLSHLNEVLCAVGERDGIKNLRLGRHGTTGIELRNGSRFHFEYHQSAGKLFIYTPLRLLPDDEHERLILCETLLYNSCLAADGITAAVHRTTRQVLLQLILDAAQVNVEQLDRALDRLSIRRETLLSSSATKSAGHDAADSLASSSFPLMRL